MGGGTPRTSVASKDGLDIVAVWLENERSVVMRPVANTDLLSIFFSSMGTYMGKRLGLHVLPFPLKLPPAPIYMVWHETRRTDNGHRWLRELVAAELRRFDA
jgi:DNA-binding transcriptional LysR family regulator